MPTESRKEIVRVKFAADLDRDRLDEYLTANFEDERVEIVDRETGEYLASQGEYVNFICPECGDEAIGILSTGGQKTYTHANDEDCEVGKEVLRD